MLLAPVCLEEGAHLVWTFEQCLLLNKVCFS